jgi:hypothetical protein
VIYTTRNKIDTQDTQNLLDNVSAGKNRNSIALSQRGRGLGGAKVFVTKIANARNNELLLIQLLVNRGGHNSQVWKFLSHDPNT